MDAATQKANAIQMLLGGEKCTVKLATGETEEVLVRRLPIALYPRMATLLGEEARLIELYCDKPEGWADNLMPESHNEIAERGNALNFTHFDPWMKRRIGVMQRLEPLTGGMENLTQRVLASMNSSPSSASSPG